jgi:hypothetical protein
LQVVVLDGLVGLVERVADAEADGTGRFDVQQVGQAVPAVGVLGFGGAVWEEFEGAVLVGHAD